MRILGKNMYYAVVAVWVFAVLCITARPAYAYVDPGSGLFFLQVMGSTFLGFTFLVRKRLSRLFGLFAKSQKETQRDIAAD